MECLIETYMLRLYTLPMTIAPPLGYRRRRKLPTSGTNPEDKTMSKNAEYTIIILPYRIFLSSNLLTTSNPI